MGTGIIIVTIIFKWIVIRIFLFKENVSLFWGILSLILTSLELIFLFLQRIVSLISLINIIFNIGLLLFLFICIFIYIKDKNE